MKKENRAKLKDVMKRAWELAYYGSKTFGGSPADYIRLALRLTWHTQKHPSVWQLGIGERFLLPSLSPKQEHSAKGQLLFAGLSL